MGAGVRPGRRKRWKPRGSRAVDRRLVRDHLLERHGFIARTQDSPEPRHARGRNAGGCRPCRRILARSGLHRTRRSLAQRTVHRPCRDRSGSVRSFRPRRPGRRDIPAGSEEVPHEPCMRVLRVRKCMHRIGFAPHRHDHAEALLSWDAILSLWPSDGFCRSIE